MFIYLNNDRYDYTITTYDISLFSHQISSEKPCGLSRRKIMRTSLADRKTDTTLFEQYVERPVSGIHIGA